MFKRGIWILLVVGIILSILFIFYTLYHDKPTENEIPQASMDNYAIVCPAGAYISSIGDTFVCVNRSSMVVNRSRYIWRDENESM